MTMISNGAPLKGIALSACIADEARTGIDRFGNSTPCQECPRTLCGAIRMPIGLIYSYPHAI